MAKEPHIIILVETFDKDGKVKLVALQQERVEFKLIEERPSDKKYEHTIDIKSSFC